MMKPFAFLNRHPWVIALAIAVAVTVWMASGQGNGEHAKVDSMQAKPVDREQEVRVTVHTQRATEVERFVRINGRTAPSREARMSAETAGSVVAVLVERGVFVKAGTPLIRLDMRDRDLRVTQARALLTQREIEFSARQSLQGEGYVSQTQMAETQAALEAARADLRNVTLDLENRDIRAPFDGAIQQRELEVGDYVKIGDPALTFVDDSILVVKASISESEGRFLDKISTGTARLITGQEVEGKLRYLAPVADASTRTFRLELELDNQDRTIPAGVTAELTLPVGKVMAHLISPALLTLDDQGQVGVKIVDSENIVHFVQADIARTEPDGIWLAGLPEVTSFITIGQGFVNDGQKVIPVPDKAISTARVSE